jgi:hypothetical protein
VPAIAMRPVRKLFCAEDRLSLPSKFPLPPASKAAMPMKGGSRQAGPQNQRGRPG